MFRPTTIVMPIALMAFAIVSFLTLIEFSVSTHLQSGEPTVIDRACTDEAKLCPDGSAVGRVGPNCEFAKCPTSSQDTATACITNDDCQLHQCSGCLSKDYLASNPVLPECAIYSRTSYTCSCRTGRCTLAATFPPNTNTPTDNTNNSEVACATDVQTCSDGSYVQRVPPSCEFADCPPGTEPVSPSLSQ